MLRFEGVHTHIGAYHILHGVEMTVPEGAITLLLGRNGVGKTTTLRTLMGLWQASRGRIVFEGKDITHYPTPDIARLGIAYVPENMGIFADLAWPRTSCSRRARRHRWAPCRVSAWTGFLSCSRP